jgi:L-alanine-DL-glutamate epimerase-like enolase superfamily enzyme
MKASWKKYKLKLKQPFVLSYGSFDFRHAYILSLEDQGKIGLGEATAITYYGWTEEKIEQELTNFVDGINKGMTGVETLAWYDFSPPVLNAVSCARLDLQARLTKQPLHRLLNIPLATIMPVSSITISGSTLDEFENQIKEHDDWSIFKIKMGSADDHIKLSVIKKHPDRTFRIDANAGWTLDWVKQHQEALQMTNIELIEQPFPIDQPELNVELKNLVKKPVFADESCRTIEDLTDCASYFDGINFKLMKCGGWFKTLEMINAARQKGLQLMLGCMTETSVGISHAAQLLGLVDMVDIDGSYLIDGDPASGTYLSKGEIHLSTGHGCGAHIKYENRMNQI